MIPNANNERQIKRHLLGDLTPEELQQVEVRLLDDEEFAAQVQLVEEELIEDYLAGALPPPERARCEAHFLAAPHRQRKLALGRALRRYAMPNRETKSVQEAVRGAAGLSWLAAFFTPRWRVAALALIVIVTSVGVWRALVYQSPVEKGLRALKQAYREQRPLAARLTVFSYAPFSETRGSVPGGEGKVDYHAREYAELLLHQAVAEKVTPTALHALGEYYLTQRLFDKAIDQLRAALQAAPNQAQLHSDLGAALLEKGLAELTAEPSGQSGTRLAESLNHLNRALELDNTLLPALFNRALVYRALKLSQPARADWETYLKRDLDSGWANEARRYLKELDEQRQKTVRRTEQRFDDFMQAYQTGAEGQAWRAFNHSFFRTGNAIVGKLLDDYLGLALKGAREEAEQKLATLAYAGELAERKTQDHHLTQQVNFYRQTTPRQQAEIAQARALFAAGYKSYESTDNSQAIERFSQARRLFGHAGDVANALLAEYWLGHCYDVEEEANRSLATLTSVVQACERQGFLWLQALSLNALALVHGGLSEYSEASRCAAHAQALAKRLEDVNGELLSARLLASFYRAVNRQRESLQVVARGLELAEEIAADATQRAGLYSTAAWDFSALGLYPAALACQQEAIGLAEESGNPLSLSRYYIHLGLIQRKLGNYAEALKQIQHGLAIGEKVPPSETSRNMIQYARLNLGHVFSETGALNSALEAFDQVIAFGREKHSPWLLYLAYKGRLLAYLKTHDVTAIDRELRTVLALFEEQRRNLQEESNRNSFFDSEQNVYDLAIDFAFSQLQSPPQAFTYAELSRARSLLDAKQTVRPLVTETAQPELRLTNVTTPAIWSEVRQRLPEGVQLLQYAVLEDKLIIWLISSTRAESRVVPVPLRQLTTFVQDYLAWISQPPHPGRTEIPEVAKTLYGWLIQPVEDLFNQQQALCIVPDKVLCLLPFGTLVARPTNQYLIERFKLFYAPSASLLLACSDEARKKAGSAADRLLSVGNPRFNRHSFPDLPDLPDAAQEAADITAYYTQHHLLTGVNATKAMLLKELEHATVIHLALHYVPDQRSPMFSQLVLAGSESSSSAELFSTYELYRLNLTRARLVVLSACQTGGEVYWQGEGLLGLARTFEAAGVPLVVASLWPVDSQATRELMTRFHQQHKRAGLSAVAALKEAQLTLLHNSSLGYQHPYYWAPFIAIGAEHN